MVHAAVPWEGPVWVRLPQGGHVSCLQWKGVLEGIQGQSLSQLAWWPSVSPFSFGLSFSTYEMGNRGILLSLGPLLLPWPITSSTYEGIVQETVVWALESHEPAVGSYK